MDVVLFGNFLAQYLYLPLWPKGTYRFWCLSRAVKRVLVRLLGLPAESVQVIPRYSLFPPEDSYDERKNAKGDWSLVYSGRQSYSKNFGMVLRVASALQSTLGLDVQLHVLGKFDQVGSEDFGFGQFPNYRREVKRLMDKLPWKKRPLFHGVRPAKSWTDLPVPRPVLINLSRFYMEDFGVSVAQAQQKHWPCIISGWGGHLDVRGKNVLHIPVKLLGGPLLKPSAMDELALIVASQIAHHKERIFPLPFQLPKSQKTQMGPPASIGKGELAKLHHQLLLKYSWQLLSMTRVQDDPLATFTRSDAGKKFIRRYHRIFSQATG